MRAASVKQLVRWRAAVCVLFLALCHAAPQVAHAACSHLVSSNAVRSLDWNHLDRLIVGDSSSSTALDNPRLSVSTCQSAALARA